MFLNKVMKYYHYITCPQVVRILFYYYDFRDKSRNICATNPNSPTLIKTTLGTAFTSQLYC